MAPDGVALDAPSAARRHQILIATTRAPSDMSGVFYSGQRSATLNFAAVDVQVPPNHVAGRVERPRQLPPDPERHFLIENPRRLDGAGLRSAAEAAARTRPRGQRDLMIWIHGFNTTLTDAVLRLAQFVEDTGYTGVPLLFSWASDARVTSYVYDINSALIARDALSDIGRALDNSPFDGIDLVAHSMGNFVTMEAIRGGARQDLFNSSGKLRNVILAAPDVDIDLFALQVANLPPQNRGFYVLVSDDDKALRLSSLIARRPRAGEVDAVSLARLGVNVIDLSQVSDTNSIHHTKFADAPEVVRLLGTRILAGDTYSGARPSALGEAFLAGGGSVLEVLE